MEFCSLSHHIIAVLWPFHILFSRVSWFTASELLLGAILCTGNRTVSGILRTLGLGDKKGFSKYHRILNHLDWPLKRGSEILLKMLLKLTSSERPVILIDETLERRWGKKIQAKGYYRDAVRSSKSQVVKTSGLKWLVMAFSFRFKFSPRAFALPFFTVLEPSEKFAKAKGKRHKTTLNWSIQMVKQLVRWVPAVPFILVGDGGFACAELAWVCFHNNIALISRLKMNAGLYALPEAPIPGKRGRKPKKGARLCSFKEMLALEGLAWEYAEITGYDGEKKRVKYLTNTAMWGADGFCPIAIRWVLVVDTTGEMSPLPLMSTDVNLTAIKIIELYVDRWGLEVTFQESREHLGVETQRQWSEAAIERTTPILMATYSLVCLIGNRMNEEAALAPEMAAWYAKKRVCFSDLLKAVRTDLWKGQLFYRKEFSDPSVKIQLRNEELRESIRDAMVQILMRAA